MADVIRTRVTAHIRILYELLKEYRWLTESHILEYFTRDAKSRIPQTWITFFASIQISDVGKFIDFMNYDDTCSTVPPLSLLALRKTLQQYTLPRKRMACISSLVELTCQPLLSPSTASYGDNIRFKKAFSRHVKSKKVYEIDRMAESTARLANKLNVKWVIDVGSGLGHLCRKMGFIYLLNVCGIETQPKLIEKARKWDEDILKCAKSVISENEYRTMLSHKPSHMLATVDFSTNGNDFLKLIQKCSGIDENQNFGIIGLHPCGDLAAILLKIFTSCEYVKFINIVGCCYHKMTLSGDRRGYPLSSMNSSDLQLTSESTALASHALETYSARLVEGDYEHLKIHCYRATLERIIQNRWPEYVRCSLNNVSPHPDLSFAEYCEKALQKLNFRVPECDLTSEETLDCLSRWKEVVVYFSLWTMLGPAVESVIQLDRFLYVLEHGYHCRLEAAFEAKISPRNLILSAFQ